MFSQAHPKNLSQSHTQAEENSKIQTDVVVFRGGGAGAGAGARYLHSR